MNAACSDQYFSQLLMLSLITNELDNNCNGNDNNNANNSDNISGSSNVKDKSNNRDQFDK